MVEHSDAKPQAVGLELAIRVLFPSKLAGGEALPPPGENMRFMVGDRLSDLTAGCAAGCRTLLVRTGLGRREELALAALSPDAPTACRLLAVVDHLPAAADLILQSV